MPFYVLKGIRLITIVFSLLVLLNHGAVNAAQCDKVLATVQFNDQDDKRFFAKGTVSKTNGRNWLELVFILKSKEDDRSKNLRGRETLQAILNEFESKGVKIDGLEATWSDNMRMYDGPSDNLIAFAHAYKNIFLELMNLPRESELPAIHEYADYKTLQTIAAASMKAAEATWTGSQAGVMGFSHIEAIDIIEEANRTGSDGYKGNITVRVYWSKSSAKKFSLIDSGPRGRSAMPRFHIFMEYLSRTSTAHKQPTRHRP